MKKFVFIICISVFLFSIFPSTVSANSTRSAILSRDIDIILDNEVQILTNAVGSRVFPVMFEESVYLPVRAISNILGYEIDYDENTRSVIIGESIPPVRIKQEWYTELESEAISVFVDQRLRIIYQDEEQQFLNGVGEIAYPINYRDSVYLPIRGIANMFEVSISWHNYQRNVYLSSSNEAITYNDFQLEQDLFEFINEEREANGLSPLIWYNDLAIVAREHSRSLAIDEDMPLDSRINYNRIELNEDGERSGINIEFRTSRIFVGMTPYARRLPDWEALYLSDITHVGIGYQWNQESNDRYYGIRLTIIFMTLVTDELASE